MTTRKEKDEFSFAEEKWLQPPEPEEIEEEREFDFTKLKRAFDITLDVFSHFQKKDIVRFLITNIKGFIEENITKDAIDYDNLFDNIYDSLITRDFKQSKRSWIDSSIEMLVCKVDDFIKEELDIKP